MSKRKILSFYFAKQGDPIRKSPSLSVKEEPNVIYPIMYLRKPKWVTDEAFSSIIDDIEAQMSGLSEKTVNLLESNDE